MARRARSDFDYEERSAEEIKQRANRKSSMFDSWQQDFVKMFTAETGVNKIRILPPHKSHKMKWYGLSAYFHSQIGPDSQTYLCLNKNKGEDCPVCEEYARAKMNKESDDYTRQLYAYERILVWIIDRNNEGEGVQLYPMSATLDREFAAQSADSETGEVLRIDHPYEGFDIIFSREGTGLKTKYSGLKVARNPSPISSDEEEMDQWLGFVKEHPLTSTLKFYPYEKIQAAFSGKASSNREDDEDPRRLKAYSVDELPRAPAATRRRVPVVDDDETPKLRKRPSLDESDDGPIPAARDKRFQKSREEFRDRIDEVAEIEEATEEEEVTDLRKKIRKGLQAIED